jgi:hypothetical protein
MFIRGGEEGRGIFNDVDFQLGKMKKILEMDDDNDCTTVRMNLMLLTAHLKIA